jgi:hypothetical protein
MDLLKKTKREPNRLNFAAITKAIVNHMAATAYQRAIAGLNGFQLGKMGVGRNPTR